MHEDDGRLLLGQGSREHGAGGGNLGSFAGDLAFFYGGSVHTVISLHLSLIHI